VQQVRQVPRLEERHPAKAEPGGTGREPDVLHGARAAPHVGVGERRPAEHACRWRPAVASDDDADRCLPDAVKLQVKQPGATVFRQLFRLAQPLGVGEQRGPVPGLLPGDDDEPPGL
jgi:hypothetical protein